MPRRLPLVNKLPAHLGDAVITIGLVALAAQISAFFAIYVLRLDGAAAAIDGWLALSGEALLHGRVWTLVTYGVLHDLDSPLHLFFNLYALYVLGPRLEERWGSRAFLRFFVLCVVGGGVLAGLHGLVLDPALVTVGASAGVMGLLATWAWRFPQQELLLFFLFPVKMRWVLPAVIGLDVLFALTGSPISVAAHLGGVAAAWIQLGGPSGWLARRRKQRDAEAKARRLAEAKQRLRLIPGGKDDLPN